MTSRAHPDTTALSGALLSWYDEHARALPWRLPPGSNLRPDPYAVWLSEIMLQQTTVTAAAPYFTRFLKRWPNISALAAASLDEVLAAWAGLGYYARARKAHECARQIVGVCGGEFPPTEQALRGLPGVGPYTAAAIAAIAFDRRALALDANAERVFARLFAIETPFPKGKRELHTSAETLVPAKRPGDFAQALMDLGSMICTSKRPACVVCPLAEFCRARMLGLADLLPRKAPKPERPTRRGAAFVLKRADGAIFFRRRPPKGLLGGMLEVPSTIWAEGAMPMRTVALKSAPAANAWRKRAGVVAHTFTHFHLELEVYAGRPGSRAPEGLWAKPDELASLALPSLMRKIVAHAGKDET